MKLPISETGQLDLAASFHEISFLKVRVDATFMVELYTELDKSRIIDEQNSLTEFSNTIILIPCYVSLIKPTCRSVVVYIHKKPISSATT